MAIEEGAWFWYQVTEAIDGELVGNPVREIYTVTSIRGKAAEVKKEVPGLKEPETLHTMKSYGSYIFDIDNLSPIAQETIDTCVGKVKCDVCKLMARDEEITAYVDKNNIVYRYSKQIKRADGQLHTYAYELVALGL